MVDIVCVRVSQPRVMSSRIGGEQMELAVLATMTTVVVRDGMECEECERWCVGSIVPLHVQDESRRWQHEL